MEPRLHNVHMHHILVKRILLSVIFNILSFKLQFIFLILLRFCSKWMNGVSEEVFRSINKCFFTFIYCKIRSHFDAVLSYTMLKVKKIKDTLLETTTLKI